MSTHITLPFTEAQAVALRAGERVLISGVVYTARDAAHRRLEALLLAGEPLPVELRDQIIYYAGPAPAPPGAVIGAVGPTTSYRMDSFVPRLMGEAGLRGMIGKGDRSAEVIEAIVRHRGAYFAAVGGAGALLAQRVEAVELAAWPELGAEAIRRLTVRDFPALVAVDRHGNDLYVTGPADYLSAGPVSRQSAVGSRQ